MTSVIAIAELPSPPLTAEEQLAKWAAYIQREAGRWARLLTLDLEELKQDIHLQVLRYFGNFDPRLGSFSSWLTRVIRTVALSTVDYRKHHTVKALSLSTPLRRFGSKKNLGELIPDLRRNEVADDVVHRDLIQRIRDAIEALPERQRNAVRARFWRDAPRKNRENDIDEGLAELAETLSDLAPDVGT